MGGLRWGELRCGTNVEYVCMGRCQGRFVLNTKTPVQCSPCSTSTSTSTTSTSTSTPTSTRTAPSERRHRWLYSWNPDCDKPRFATEISNIIARRNKSTFNSIQWPNQLASGEPPASAPHGGGAEIGSQATRTADLFIDPELS